jgi:hypothetical protein
MEVETITLYSGEEEFIVNADEVNEYLKLGLTKRKAVKPPKTENG